MWHSYYMPASLQEALALLARHRDACRVIAGGTDLILELERGVRRQEVLIDITRIPGLDEIRAGDGLLQIGPLVTHNQVVGSPVAVADAYPLARACWEVGAPQIRNRGTVAGNLVTASPANDTITPLWAMDGRVVLASQARGQRTLPFDDFYLGVRRTALQDDEMLLRIEAPLLRPTERGAFLKLGLRRAQAISVVNVAVIVDFEGEETGAAPGLRGVRSAKYRRCSGARIALGAVAPTIVRARAAETFLAGRELSDEVIERASRLAVEAARPISDIRAEAWYRSEMVRVLAARALRQLRDGEERASWPDRPVMLWGSTDGRFPPARHIMPQPLRHAAAYGVNGGDAIHLTVNGEPHVLRDVHGKTLLDALRDDLGLTGTKEGCAEGECGACTVWLDGIAVMSCLVPVERADGCRVVTVEGLAGASGALHPIQDAFIQEGAVQCGYCTPGLLMSGASLLAELPHPTVEQIGYALTGNLCRCTGYYSIVKAVERAASTSSQEEA